MTTPNAPNEPQGMDQQNSETQQPDSAEPQDGRRLPEASAPRDATREVTNDATRDETPTGPQAAPEPAASPAKAEPTSGPVPEPVPEAASRHIQHGDSAESFDEAAVRALMRDAVQSIEPSAEALNYLRRAVPARRQHRRQALAGAVAAVLLVGMAVPALVRAAGHESRTSASTGHVAGSPVPSSSGPSGRPGGSVGGAGVPTPSPGAPGNGPDTSQPPPRGGVGGTYYNPSGGLPVHRSGGGGGGPVPASAPLCSGSQLGQGASDAKAPDAGGKVYGWFRVANVSGTSCTVPDGGGQVDVVAQGAADASQIAVVDHTAGDPAGGLPPAAPHAPIVLGPGEDYEVAFAWVPADTGPGGCPVPASPTETPTPSDTPTTPSSSDPGGGGTPGTGTDTGAVAPHSGSDVTPDPSAPPASVALNHTPVPGAPVVDGPVIQDACAGTIYTTTVGPTAPADAATPTP